MADDKVIPCASEEMQHIRQHLQQADNDLIAAQYHAMRDVELSERILEVRRLLTELIYNTK